MTIVGDAFGRPLARSARKHDLRPLLAQAAHLGRRHPHRGAQARVPGAAARPAHPRRARLVGERRAGLAVDGRRAARRRRATSHSRPGNLVLKEDLSGVLAPGSARERLAGARGRDPARLLQGRREDGAHLPGGRRRALRGARRPGHDRGRRHAPPPRPRLRHDQHGRREGLRRGSRAGPQAPPCGLRRRGGGYDARALRPAGDGDRAAARRERASRPTTLRETAREHIAPFKLPRAVLFVDEIVRSPSGKADYRWAKATAEEKLGLSS